MFSEVRKRAKKVGQPPGTAMYTGTKHDMTPTIHVITYDENSCHEQSGTRLEDCLSETPASGITWVDVKGLNDVNLIEQISNRFNLHPLTVEDILNVEQRPKVDEFEAYLFITLKVLQWNHKKATFAIHQLSLVLGDKFVLSFHETDSTIFENVQQRLCSQKNQRMRQQGCDYLIYRLIDAAIDEYFIVLEALGDAIAAVEEDIIVTPQPQNSRAIYKLKRKMLLLRKAVWPMREVISHLLNLDSDIITKFTRIYLRDVYDHTVQSIDSIDTFRDMLSSMLDMYLSSLTNRMNEIMKTLTIITTIFIPITAIASIYGMNFAEIPGLKWHYGYPTAIASMVLIAIGMLIYFKRKKWI